MSLLSSDLDRALAGIAGSGLHSWEKYIFEIKNHISTFLAQPLSVFGLPEQTLKGDSFALG